MTNTDTSSIVNNIQYLYNINTGLYNMKKNNLKWLFSNLIITPAYMTVYYP